MRITGAIGPEKSSIIDPKDRHGHVTATTSPRPLSTPSASLHVPRTPSRSLPRWTAATHKFQSAGSETADGDRLSILPEAQSNPPRVTSRLCLGLKTDDTRSVVPASKLRRMGAAPTVSVFSKNASSRPSPRKPKPLCPHTPPIHIFATRAEYHRSVAAGPFTRNKGLQ